MTLRDRPLRLLISAALLGLAPAAFSQTTPLPPASFSYGLIDANGNASVLTSGATITFPPTSLGATAAVTVSITNAAGDAAGTVTSISATGAAFQLSGTPLPGTMVAGGSTVTFSVKFAPTQLAAVQGSLTIVAGGVTTSFNLAGSGTGAVYSYQVQQGSTTTALAPSQTITFPNTQTGQTSTATITVTNSGNVSGQIASIAILGSGFQLANLPFLPATLAVQSTLTFQVVFAPTQPGAVTGALQIGADTFNLTGNALGASYAFAYVSGGTTVTLPNTGGTVLFSPTAVGASSSSTFSISNGGNTAGVITSIGIGNSSGQFSVSNLPSLPVTLAPGASVSFVLTFTPSAAGVATADLIINTFSFSLTGTGTPPPALPSYSFSGATGVQKPLTQPAIGLTLASPYSLAVTGTLTLTFTSAEFTDDPSIQFATGGRTVNFTIPANTTSAVFSNGATTVMLSTGSVAGTIALTPSFATASGVNLTPASPLALNLTIAPSAPGIVSTEIDSPTATGFTVTFTGYATGRDMTSIDFHFTMASGVTVSVPDITLSVQTQFSTWYGSSASDAYGSQFTASVPFTLSGQLSGISSLINAIQSVTVTLTNAEGTSAGQTVTVQ